MGKKCYSVVLLVAIAAVALASSGTVEAVGRLFGGWSPIANPSDPSVQDLGKFAVSEHNSQTGDNLAFIKVTSGQSQVVAGTNYKLLLLARSGSVTHTYEAFVYERTWENVRQLKSFALEK